jgi:hypothetical protein
MFDVAGVFAGRLSVFSWKQGDFQEKQGGD